MLQLVFEYSAVKLNFTMTTDRSGKQIRQRFTKKDFCWEQEIVISLDLNNCSYFIIIYIDNEEYD